MEESLKNRTIKGVLWSSVDRFSGQAIHLIVVLIIARILSPKDFGLVGMLTVFIFISQSLVDSGFSQALIRKQNRTEVDISSVFYFNIVVSIFLYIILFLIAPYVAIFYEEPQLTRLMRVLCLVVIINSFSMVQGALFTATINFKVQAKATFIASLISGVCGILMALYGFGVWSLVSQYIVSSSFIALFYWVFSSWRPHRLFSWDSIRELFSFGSKMMLGGVINTIYGNMYQLVIGKIFSADKLGHYSQAQTITSLPSANISRIMDRVTYPVLCSLQNENERLESSYRKLLRMSVFLIFPMMCLLAAISIPLVELVIGEKWHYAATLIIPLCFALMWHPVHSINLNLLKVKGRSDLFLRLEIIKDCMGVIILIIGIPFGLTVMCYLQIITSLVALMINTYYTGKLLGLGFFKQMRDILPILLLSLLLFVTVFGMTSFFDDNLVKLVIGVPLGCLFYLFGSYLFKFQELSFLKETIKNRI